MGLHHPSRRTANSNARRDDGMRGPLSGPFLVAGTRVLVLAEPRDPEDRYPALPVIRVEEVEVDPTQHGRAEIVYESTGLPLRTGIRYRILDATTLSLPSRRERALLMTIWTSRPKAVRSRSSRSIE